MSARPRRKLLETGTPVRPMLLLIPQQPSTRARLQPRELWIGAHLPQLALEALAGDRRRKVPPVRTGGDSPLAVTELEERAQHIVAANEPAVRAGVRAGMSVATALALLPQLSVKPRDVRRERGLLERLATCAQRFTPRVSLEPPDGMLLEIKGSLHLFGGAAKLTASFLADCAAAGSRPRLAIAPTPLAALAAARAGIPFEVTDGARLTGALAPLPLAVLRWPPEVLERLCKAGVRTIGEALRLPRGGFARRFGRESLADLDRLVGHGADLRIRFGAPERFGARREFTYELERHDALLAAMTPLLEDLANFLRVRQCGITALECRLRHRHAPATRCVLKLAAPAADPQRLKALLGERLAALDWPEPVRSCELRSGKLVPRPLGSDALWQPGEQGGGSRIASTDLIESLRARLGFEAVHGLEIHPTHRPEDASRVRLGLSMQPAGADTEAASAPPWPAFRRPLWLLTPPEPLSSIDALPCSEGGPLRLLGEPERIESGWWDAEGTLSREVARDYYHALDPKGARLWIFRERLQPHRWFLHGVFG
ncbi:MAG TPA: DNA polymerase Y family protein [Steroidobacteraceae bacterium]|nr:DNA polymerase Y family protein [Steroidobacteraceae bacterium]